MPTNWISFRERYGFSKPYNFRVAIPFIISSFVLVATASAFTALYCLNEMDIGTYRFYFFSYTMALLSIAALASRRPFISYPILTWCAVELGLCLLFHTEPEAMQDRMTAHAANLLPENAYAQPDGPLATYHPLLIYSLKPNLKGDSGGNPWKPGSPGFSTNALGLRGAEIGAEQLARELIFFYGGSTTFDVGVSNSEETWVSLLQRELRYQYTTVNLGVPGYATTHHLIQTTLYQGILGKKPGCAVYYIGWNDLFNAHAKNLDRGYANFLFLFQAHHALRKPAPGANYSPLLRILYAIAFNAVVNIQKFSPVSEGASTGDDERLEEIFREHVRTLTLINRAREIKTVYIGQILNRARLTSGRPNLFPFVAAEDTWPLQQRFNAVLQKEATEGGATYIDAGIDNFEDHDFVDQGHFSPEGAKKFARLIAREIAIGCRAELSQPVSVSALREP